MAVCLGRDWGAGAHQRREINNFQTISGVFWSKEPESWTSFKGGMNGKNKQK
jgi:hypothetical protein